MLHMKLVFVFVLLLLVIPGAVQSKDWNGIILYQSTCEDVKKILKVEKCDYRLSKYQLANEKIHILFSEAPCDTASCAVGNKGEIKPVVVQIEREFKVPRELAEFGIDDSWDKTTTDVVGDIIYGNSKEGIMVYSADGKAYSVIYYPTKKEKETRCKKLKNSSMLSD